MSALNKTDRMTQHPRGHNWQTEQKDPETIALLTVLHDGDPNAPEDHYIGNERHRVVKCVRCAKTMCFDCGMIRWSQACEGVSRA